MKFLVHPKPFFDESLKGYIARLTTLNQYKSDSWIYQKTGLVYENGYILTNINNISPSRSSLAQLAEVSDNQAYDLWGLTFYNQFGDLFEKTFNDTLKNHLRKFALNNRDTRFCPICLEENVYFRKLWELDIYNVCHKHNCLMISKCPKCSKKVTLRIPPIGNCECGFIFSHSDPIFVSEEFSILEKAIYAKVFATSCQELIDNQLLKIDFRLFIFLVVDLSKLLMKLFNGDDSNSPLKFNYEFTSTAYKAFNYWPNEFYTFIELYRNNYMIIKNVKSRGLSEFGTLGSSILNKYKKLEGQLDFLILEFENYIFEKWDGVLLGQAATNFTKKSKWTFLEDAVKELNTSQDTLKKLINEKKLRFRRIQIGKRLYLAILNDDIIKFKKVLKNRISKTTASKILSVTKTTLNELIEGGIINGNINTLKLMTVNKSSVLSFLNNLEGKSKPVNEAVGNVLSFQETVKIFRLSGSSIVELLDLINKGKLSIFREGNEKLNGLKRYYLLENETKNYFQKDKYFTLTQLARELNVVNGVISSWIKNGYLNGEILPRGSRILKEDVDKFFDQYIVLNEVADRIDQLPKVAKRMLGENNICPISGYEIDGVDKYLFVRKEVENFISSYLESKKTDGLSNEVYSIKQLVDLLKTDRNILRQWIKSGYLNPNKIKDGTKLLFSKSEVTKFNQNFMMLNEISKRMNLKSIGNARKYLAEHSVFPINENHNATSTKYLYERKRLEAFISSYLKQNSKIKKENK
jgi:hypothetical protein